MNRTGYFTIVFLLFILIGAFIFYVQVQKEIQEEVLQTSLAANSLKVSSDTSYLDINGNPVSLKQYVGENVLAFAWASWCPSCGQQLQDLSKISKKYDDVTVLAFNRAEPKETVLNYLNFFGLIDTVELILDPTDHFFFFCWRICDARSYCF